MVPTRKPARRFEASEKFSKSQLMATMRNMGATSLKINANEFTGEVEIVFDRKGKRYVFRASKYPYTEDNLRAAQLSIRYLYQAYEEYDVHTSEKHLVVAPAADPFEQVFAGFAALPDDKTLLLGAGADVWWKVLGVSPDASVEAINNAYRALAWQWHPDRNSGAGAQERMKRLNEARDEGLAAVKGRKT